MRMWCTNCKKKTEDYYMLHDALWYSVAEAWETLCIVCFEERLGRELTKDDFSNVPVNADWWLNTYVPRSELHKQRMEK